LRLGQGLLEEFEQSGRVWIRGAIPEQDLTALEAAASLGPRPGQRIGLAFNELSCFSPEGSITTALAPILPGARPVRVVGFNKSEAANWVLPWHQDRVIAVDARENVAGFGNWTSKSGVWHCEPPIEILQPMLFVRLHLDDASEANGAMRIAVGSHRAGFVAAADAACIAERCPEEVATARRGDILVLKMLTLHRSRPSQSPAGRRTLRIDFANFDLPPPLAWA